jgi:hypothetical protein
VIAYRHHLARVHVARQSEGGGGACLDVAGVDQAHRRGPGLQVLTDLDEALADHAREGRADHGLLDLVLRFAPLCLGTRQIVARHFALGACVLELAGAQRLCGREAVETLELGAVDVTLCTCPGHLGAQVLEAQPRDRVIEPGERLALTHSAADFGDPHHAPRDHAGDARVRAADDRAGNPALDRHRAHAHGADLHHCALDGGRIRRRGRGGRQPAERGERRQRRRAQPPARAAHGSTGAACAAGAPVSWRWASSRIRAGISTRLNARLMTTPPMLTAASPR